MIFNKNLQLILSLMDIFQDFRIEFISPSAYFSIICDKSQNLEIFYYLIIVNIRGELKDSLLFNNSWY